MADERQKTLPAQKALIPRDLDWESLERLDGDDLDTHYRHILVELGKKPGMLGTIFRKAQNKIQDPAKLKRLVSDLIGREQWTILGVDVKGDAYEGLLEKNAADVKGGAGQYFTPRALIRAIVDVMRPEPGQLIHDPACGTGGFLLAVHDYITEHYQLDKDDKRFLKEKALSGTEIVDAAARLCTMNMFLHGIGGEDSVTVGRRTDREGCPRLRYGADQSAVRQEVEHHRDRRGWRGPARGADHRARRLLGDHQQQAIELPAARALNSQDRRPRGHCGAG